MRKGWLTRRGSVYCNLSGTAGLIFQARLKENLWDGLFMSKSHDKERNANMKNIAELDLKIKEMAERIKELREI